MSDEILLEKTNKGKEKLIINGYSYHLQIKYKENYRWTCVKNRSDFCRGKVITIIENGQHKILKKGAGHNHTPIAFEKEVCRVNNLVKNKANNDQAAPSQIIRHSILDCESDCRIYLPTEIAQKQKINRVRSLLVKEPTTLEEVEIPENLRYLEGEKFILSEKSFHGGNNFLLGTGVI